MRRETRSLTRWIGFVGAVVVVGVAGWFTWTHVSHPSRARIPVVRFLDVPANGRDGGTTSGTMGDQTRAVLPLLDDGLEATFESRDVQVPTAGELTFALGATFDAGTATDRVVTFEVRACRAAACDTVFSERVDFTSPSAEGWLKRRVTLAQLAGTPRRFVFLARRSSPTTRVLWATPTLRPAIPRDASARNLILVSLDTLRADHLGSYGYRHDTAPFMDATFARGGTLFEHCVAAATTTMASHMTMFTSVPPSVHGVGLEAPVALPSSIAPLPELLQAAGFTTGAITEDGWVTIKRFGRGFDTYQENTGPDLMEPKGQVDVTFGQAKEWLASHRDERFFLFLHTYQVHYPYAPPKDYAALFADPAATPSGAAADATNYDREIRFVDDTFRDLFATIRSLGLDDETIVIVTSDHGEEFGEHGCQYHGPHLYEEVAHVPLMMWGPGIPAGRRIAEPVGLLDLLPTILDLAGVAIPRQAMGQTLVPALASGHAEAGRRLSTEAWSVLNCGGHVYKSPGVALRVDAQKIARYDRDGSNGYELYDLAADPGERRNRYDETSAGVLKDLVDRYLDDCRTRAAALRGQGGPESVPTDVPIDDRQREKLRALGYLD